MISFPLISLIVIIFLLYFLFRMRYDSSGRTFILKLMCSLQNIPSLVLKSNPKLCKAVLDASDTKGHGLEMYFALPGWLPIYNSESVDGERWKRLLSIFRKIVHKLDYAERLPAITLKHTQRACEENENIDSIAIQKLTVRVFFELLFKKEITIEDEILFIDATNEWRKHVAQKGESDLALKERMIDRIMEHLRESQFDIEGLQNEFKADKYEMVSSFMQPFLISPIINFSDIFCEAALYLDQNPEYQRKLGELALDQNENKGDAPISLFVSVIYEAIRLKHPFPVLERETTRDVTDGKVIIPKGTHVYIELDCFMQSQKFEPENWMNTEFYKENSWILFATGPRMCAGRMIALQVLEEMMRLLVLNKKADFKKLRMWDNHKISGRRNDNTVSFKEVIFQVKVIGRVFKEILTRRR